MKFVRFLFPGLILISPFACRTHLMVPSDAEVSIAHNRWPDADIHTLQQGYSLYQENCSKCHSLYKPTEYSEPDWDDILPEMTHKAHLNADQSQLIRKFIFTRRSANLKK